jgi:hypothetical protein
MNKDTNQADKNQQTTVDIHMRLDTTGAIVQLDVNSKPPNASEAVSLANNLRPKLPETVDCCSESNSATEDSHPDDTSAASCAAGACAHMEKSPAATEGNQLNSSPCAMKLYSFNEKWALFRQDTDAYYQFIQLTSYGLLIFGIAVLLQFGVYSLFFTDEVGFIAQYAWWFFYLNITVVSLVIALTYLRSFDLTNCNCMLGMMIGMVIGMQTAAMMGAVIAPINGYFMGAMVGIISGALMGLYIGIYCNSTMAVVQGLMSGVMMGPMGSMTIAMMLRDGVLVFMPLFTLFNILVLVGGGYLFYEDVVKIKGKAVLIKNYGFFPVALTSLGIIALLVLIMLYGHRGGIYWEKVVLG